MVLTFAFLCDIILKYLKDVPVAQLDRVTGYEPVGRGFESLQARHVYFEAALKAVFLFASYTLKNI